MYHQQGQQGPQTPTQLQRIHPIYHDTEYAYSPSSAYTLNPPTPDTPTPAYNGFSNRAITGGGMQPYSFMHLDPTMSTRMSFLQQTRISFMDETPDAQQSAQAAGPLIVQVDPEGDMWLLTRSKNFQVSSKALALASPTFGQLLRQHNYQQQLQAMLLGNNGNNSGFAVLRLEGDDVDTVELCLRIIHHSPREHIPTCLAPDGILKVAAVCHKYDFSNALRSWSYRWLRHIPFKDKCADAVRWTALAWVLRDEGTFKSLTRYLVRNCRYMRVSENGEAVLVDTDGSRVAAMGEGMPQIIIDAIEMSIEDLHTRLATSAQKLLMRYWTATHPICKCPTTATTALACDRLQLAALMHHLKKVSMAPKVLGEPHTSMNFEAIAQFNNVHDPSTNSLTQGIDSRRRTAERLLATFKGVTENFARELEGNHAGCSPFAELWEEMRRVDTPGLDLWEVLAEMERRQEQLQREWERMRELEREQKERFTTI